MPDAALPDASESATRPAGPGLAQPEDFLQLLKPRVMSLVVFTAATGLIAAGGDIHPLNAALAVLCIAVGAGAAGALNMGLEGRTDALMGQFFAALKPGGVLAVEQHRAPAGSDPDATAPNGYVSEAYVIAAAEKAGFVLEDRSELNANPKDDRDHACGVWTLPPTRRGPEQGCQITPEQRAEYDAIGESDRMTLRFRKPS